MPTDGRRGRKPSQSPWKQEAKGRGQSVRPPSEPIAVQSSSRFQNLQAGRTSFTVSKAKGAEVYAEYSRNPLVKDAFDKIISAVFSLKMAFTAQNDYKKNPEFEIIDQRVIADLECQFKNLKYETFENVLRSMLRKAMTYGYAIAEMEWFWNGERHQLKNIKPKQSYNFDFMIDPYDNIKSVTWTPAGKVIEGKELDKLLITTWPYVEDGNYFGISELNSILYELDLIDALEKVLVNGASKAVNRKMVHTYDPQFVSGRERESYNSVVDDFGGEKDIIHLPGRVDSVTGVMTPAHLIDLLDERPSQTALREIREFLDSKYRAVYRALGVPDNTGSGTADNGSFAKDSGVEENILSTTVDTAAKWVKSMVNRLLVPVIVRYNALRYAEHGLPEGYILPEWGQEEIEEEWVLEKVEYLAAICKAGFADPEEPQFREKLDLGPRPEKEQPQEQAVTAPLTLVENQAEVA